MTLMESFQRAYTPYVTVRPASERKRRSFVAALLGFTLGVIAGRLVSTWGRLRPIVLSLAAFAALTYGAFTVSVAWGCVALAGSLLALEWRVAEE
jgi:uncharacterized membrane protein YoaK (UPF0700 family)